MNEAGPASAERPFLVSLFSVMGRIGPRQYWLHIACAAVLFVGTFFFAATAALPTGNDGGLLLAFPLLIAFIWVLVAAIVQRLRDAGKHPALGLLVPPLLIGAIFLSIELIEAASPFVSLAAVFLILFVVGHIDTITKTNQAIE